MNNDIIPIIIGLSVFGFLWYTLIKFWYNIFKNKKVEKLIDAKRTKNHN